MKKQIIIDEDGWVQLSHKGLDNKLFEIGLGDLNVDVEIIDNRK